MRIIAGSYRSRQLTAPPGLATRPTSDRLRETLFNVLAPRIIGASFLDLYAGSGAVGIEALSRGAAHVEFVERGPAALTVLKKNLERLEIVSGFRIQAAGVRQGLLKWGRSMGGLANVENRRDDELRFPTHPQKARMDGAPGVEGALGFEGSPRMVSTAREVGREFDIVFLDPPYDAAAEYAATLGLLGGAAADLLADGALVISEHRKKERLEESYGTLGRTRLLEQGDAALSFYAAGKKSIA